MLYLVTLLLILVTVAWLRTCRHLALMLAHRNQLMHALKAVPPILNAVQAQRDIENDPTIKPLLYELAKRLAEQR